MKILIPFLISGLSVSSYSQNYIDKYLSDQLNYVTVASSVNGLDQPKDLDFKPNTNELWVSNYNGVWLKVEIFWLIESVYRRGNRKVVELIA